MSDRKLEDWESLNTGENHDFVPLNVVTPVRKEKSKECEIDVEHLRSLRFKLSKEESRITCFVPIPNYDMMVLDNVLCADECYELINYTESMKYTFWNPHSDVATTNFRNADTIEVLQPAMSQLL